MGKTSISELLHRAVWPFIVFVAVFSAHLVWQWIFPEYDSGQWISMAVTADTSWWRQYIDGQNYFIGYSYALSFSFAAVALRRYRREKLCGARNLAAGTVSASGIFAVAGCYLLGCCGSPMLAVYISLFGASFLPFTKPLVAVLTTVFIGSGWWWMDRLYKKQARLSAHDTCDCS